MWLVCGTTTYFYYTFHSAFEIESLRKCIIMFSFLLYVKIQLYVKHKTVFIHTGQTHLSMQLKQKKNMVELRRHALLVNVLITKNSHEINQTIPQLSLLHKRDLKTIIYNKNTIVDVLKTEILKIIPLWPTQKQKRYLQVCE